MITRLLSGTRRNPPEFASCSAARRSSLRDEQRVVTSAESHSQLWLGFGFCLLTSLSVLDDEHHDEGDRGRHAVENVVPPGRKANQEAHHQPQHREECDSQPHRGERGRITHPMKKAAAPQVLPPRWTAAFASRVTSDAAAVRSATRRASRPRGRRRPRILLFVLTRHRHHSNRNGVPRSRD